MAYTTIWFPSTMRVMLGEHWAECMHCGEQWDYWHTCDGQTEPVTVTQAEC